MMSEFLMAVMSVLRGGSLPGLTALMVATTLVLAQTNGRIDLESVPDDFATDEIYDGARQWRESPAARYNWRPPPPKEKGRIKFGYDDVFERERQLQRQDTFQKQFGLDDPVPAADLRLQFD
jgi:hypothetical protein